jgi:hypothetical protein
MHPRQQQKHTHSCERKVALTSTKWLPNTVLCVLAWISTSLDYPKTKAVRAAQAVKTSCMSFHQGTVTGLFSNPEANTIGR